MKKGIKKKSRAKSFELETITNYLLFPILMVLLTNVFYLNWPSNPFISFTGSIIFWYLFAETSFKRSNYFKLHRTYRYVAFSVITMGIILNAAFSYFLSPNYVVSLSPIFLCVTILTILMGYEEGLASGLYLAFMTTTINNFSIEDFVILSVVALFSALLTRKILRRINIARAGFEVGIIFLSIRIIDYLFNMKFNTMDLTFSFLNPVISSIIAVGIIPYIEYVSRIYSDVGLLELGNLSHPLLKELSLNAPGTYYHSVAIANLAEAAAEMIGANAVLARVASYFHDIGKSRRPQYFTENQREINPHDGLTPSMSSLVISEHVKLGVELARKYRLPLLVEDIIREHHGTRVKKYFYHKAKSFGDANIENFRYPGPKPQFKESGIIMLADSVEAAFKSLKDPSLGKIKELVEDIVNGIYNERQLDQSGLNLSDLEEIIDAFTRVLVNTSQSRIEYPKEKVEKVVISDENRNRKPNSKDNRS